MSRGSIILVGMMLSGKSTVGKRLAERLKLPFVDLDRAIEASSGLSISVLIRRGEEGFRKIESSILATHLDKRKAVVLATGGGAFEDAQSRKHCLKTGVVVYLKARIETLMSRHGRDDTVRPLLENGNPEEALVELTGIREVNYMKAHHAIEVDGLKVDEIVNEIVNAYQSRNS